jgi:hypothetical protein
MTAKATSSVASIRPTRSKHPRSHCFPRIAGVLALLVVLIFFGAGFAVHLLWIAAVVLLVLWVVGFAIGRGEGAGSRRFYRW